MPVTAIRKQFDSYKIWYYSARQYSWRVNMQLYKGGGVVGRLMFMKKGQPLPDNHTDGNLVYLYYPIRRFEEIMGILRYEKPLYVALVPSNKIGYVGTADLEPVGEEESDP